MCPSETQTRLPDFPEREAVPGPGSGREMQVAVAAGFPGNPPPRNPTLCFRSAAFPLLTARSRRCVRATAGASRDTLGTEVTSSAITLGLPSWSTRGIRNPWVLATETSQPLQRSGCSWVDFLSPEVSSNPHWHRRAPNGQVDGAGGEGAVSPRFTENLAPRERGRGLRPERPAGAGRWRRGAVPHSALPFPPGHWVHPSPPSSSPRSPSVGGCIWRGSTVCPPTADPKCQHPDSPREPLSGQA